MPEADIPVVELGGRTHSGKTSPPSVVCKRRICGRFELQRKYGRVSASAASKAFIARPQKAAVLIGVPSL
mgnify:CR=1 FL=1